MSFPLKTFGRPRTPYAITCEEHGFVYLTKQEYDRQLSRPDDLWRCPVCRLTAFWSDENYDSFFDTEFSDGTPVEIYEDLEGYAI